MKDRTLKVMGVIGGIIFAAGMVYQVFEIGLQKWVALSYTPEYTTGLPISLIGMTIILIAAFIWDRRRKE